MVPNLKKFVIVVTFGSPCRLTLPFKKRKKIKNVIAIVILLQRFIPIFSVIVIDE